MKLDIERLAGNGKTAALARLLMIAFSVIGTIVAPIIGWMSHEAYLAFSNMHSSIERVEIAIAAFEERSKQRGAQIDSLRADNIEQGKMLLDHDRRITRIEAARDGAR
jgi:hypothetical protein